MIPDIKTAIEEIRQAFKDHPVDVEEESQGGAYVIVRHLSIGEQFTPSKSWVGFTIPFQYPHADVYPHFLDGGTLRGQAPAQGLGLSYTQWRGQQVLQISRRSPKWNANTDTAALKLVKVLDWIRGNK